MNIRIISRTGGFLAARGKSPAAIAGVLFLAGAIAAAVVSSGYLAPAAADSQDQGVSRVLMVYCTPDGFDQDEIHVRPGAHTVIIRNNTGLDGLSFSISRPGQDAVTAPARIGQRVSTVVALNPGTHVIREAAHPEWECRVVVEP